MLRSGIRQGMVFHRRVTPKPHAFDYPVFMCLLDLDEVEKDFGRSRWWSVGRFNLVSFQRSDYLRGEKNLKSEVVKRIHDHTGKRFDGKVFLLTNPRYLGLCFNPVSFYVCCEARSGVPRFILAEINNTPWNERHCYVLECAESPPGNLEFKFDKQFHVSPFMPMDLEYRWRFRFDGDDISIRMTLYDDHALCFSAGLELSHVPLTKSSMIRTPLKYPFMTASVLARIYWQAFRLWLKRVPSHDHPSHQFDKGRI